MQNASQLSLLFAAALVAANPDPKLNRAFSKAAWSGYVPKVHLVTAENVAKDGGPKNLFDPDNGYRNAYKTIWGK